MHNNEVDPKKKNLPRDKDSNQDHPDETDPQEKMEGPVSSLVQNIKENVEENNEETKEEADRRKEKNT